METIKNIWKNPTESIELALSRKFKWIEVLPLFAISGIHFIYIYIRETKGYNLSSNGKLLGAIIALILIGSVWGIVTNLFLGYLIKICGRLLQAEGNLKKIYTVIAWSSIPLIISCTIIFLNLCLARVVQIQEGNSSISFSIAILAITLYILMVLATIWSFTLFFKGLKFAQNLNSKKTIFNYILAISIYIPIYYLFISIKV